MILMSIALESIRIAIGIVFLLSTLGKLKDLRGFLQGVKAYKILPAPLAIGYGLLLVPCSISNPTVGWSKHPYFSHFPCDNSRETYESQY
jgi:uncharacterized membrane protein YphA (DoxX/SURF4 family)